MQHMDRTPEQPEPCEAEPPDEKVVQLVPRSRPVPERRPEPPEDDEDDPGPAAA